MNLDLARTVADAVLYEGYLLYPYRASSDKNRARWQFGVLGPTGAAEAGVGEESSMSIQCLLTEPSTLTEAVEEPLITVHLRCLQLQRRQLYDVNHRSVEQLNAGGNAWLSWDEAVEREVTVPLPLSKLAAGPIISPLDIGGGEESEQLTDDGGVRIGSIVRRRWSLAGRLRVETTRVSGLTRLTVQVDNVTTTSRLTKDWAIRRSLIGAHLLVEARGAAFVSLLEPPEQAREAAAACAQHRCWPVLTGAPGDADLVLGSPIILYDYPEIAAESAGALFDATEIDEILTLRVMTMTDEEKAEARATDPRAREIIDRCDAMTPAALQQLHGILRTPRAGDVRGLDPPSFETDVPWWDPAADAAVRPELDVVTINDVPVSAGSLVRVHPSRRADAQDLFFAGEVAKVTAVLADVDGEVHVALVLLDDPAADLHEEAGRYFYFSPDELEPLEAGVLTETAGHTGLTSRDVGYRASNFPGSNNQGTDHAGTHYPATIHAEEGQP